MHSQLYRSYKVSATLYQSDLRISNHRGHKFPPLLMLLSFKTWIEWPPVLIASTNSELTSSTPALSKATSKLFSSQGCPDDKNCLYFSSFFFKICRFRSSILLPLYVFIPQEATESGLTVARFSWTNQNSFPTYSNQWDCLNCKDNRLCQMAFFVFVKVGGVQGKGQLSSHVEDFEIKKAFSVVVCFFII